MSFFICASGMTLKLAFDRRNKFKTAKEAYLLYVKRAFGIMDIGMLNLILKDTEIRKSLLMVEALYVVRRCLNISEWRL